MPSDLLRETAFQRPEGAKKLLRAIQTMDLPQHVRIMEVCGTHTMAIARAGLRQLMPPDVELISGPGCPVCVTPSGALDEILRLTDIPDLILASYGDLLRVPGSNPGDTLQHRRALGADVRWVYSPMDCLDIAEANPNRQVVFLGVGFETTAPGTALAVLEAKHRHLKNFSLLSLLKRTEPAVRALVSQPELGISGLLCPGHVATILGANAFQFLPDEFHLPAVVSGFETGDLLASLYELLCQVRDQAPALVNEYTRAVTPHGNPAAQACIQQVFQPAPDVWRGLGSIDQSGFALRPAFRDFDASARFPFHPQEKESARGCHCGAIICGQESPQDCPLFGHACQPDHPVGPCMVSSEGACAAAFQFQSIGGVPHD